MRCKTLKASTDGINGLLELPAGAVSIQQRLDQLQSKSAGRSLEL